MCTQKNKTKKRKTHKSGRGNSFFYTQSTVTDYNQWTQNSGGKCRTTHNTMPQHLPGFMSTDMLRPCICGRGGGVGGPWEAGATTEAAAGSPLPATPGEAPPSSPSWLEGGGGCSWPLVTMGTVDMGNILSETLPASRGSRNHHWTLKEEMWRAIKKNVCERASICVHVCGCGFRCVCGGREMIQTKDKMNSVP